MKVIDAKIDGNGARIAIVASKFNEHITQRLLDGCIKELVKNNVKKTNITVVWVPGAFEIPVVALKLARKKTIEAVICLGAVIRGETYHFSLVAESAAYGIAQASVLSGKPVIFEILATNTVNQADKRSSLKGINKGCDAALAALMMVQTMKALS